jgi:hypothetical protein
MLFFLILALNCEHPISSGPDHHRSDGPTRTERAGERRRGKVALEHDMEHWPEGVPRMGYQPVGYAIVFHVVSPSVAHEYKIYAPATMETRIKIVGNYLRSRAPQPEPPVPVAHDPNARDPNVPVEQQHQQHVAPVNGFPAWTAGNNLSMHVYFSTSPVGDVFGVTNRKNWGEAEATGGGFPHWTWDNITYGDWVDSRKVDVMVEIPQVSFLVCIAMKMGNGRWKVY